MAHSCGWQATAAISQELNWGPARAPPLDRQPLQGCDLLTACRWGSKGMSATTHAKEQKAENSLKLVQKHTHNILEVEAMTGSGQIQGCPGMMYWVE